MKRKSEIFFFVFQETELSYISGSNFPSSKSKKKNTRKKSLKFWEMELSSPKYLYFRKEFKKPETQKN